uniref:endogenous retrovirus group K member 9 Env polyprotein-like isoform X1 n=2 Tax=Halichoerus grypus TaxID=9711 RepID=UPI0016591B85|nr:endogenous retrovirus group K member 9 Env polyprotein-like isoform X1 [Halichoerus grypus]XP_035931416.1 endogenous retrovirus group K member 9 Env polyprotein-like isoform X2 [Halichoerus grypus]
MNIYGLSPLRMQNGSQECCFIEGKVMLMFPQKMDKPVPGSRQGGSGHEPIRTAVRRRMKAPRVHESLLQADESLLQAMAHLHLDRRHHWRPPPLALPTWGHIKKLAGEGQKILKQTRKPCTPEHLFLAMCALLTMSSPPIEATNVSYWAYIPNPPMMEPAPWGSANIPIYTSPMILSPPWKNLTYLNQDDGTFFNFLHRGDGPYICLGPSPCVNMNWQNWILPGPMVNSSRTQLQRLEAWSLNMTWGNVTFDEFPSFPACPDFTYIGMAYKPFKWQECVGRFAKYYKDLLMWGPYGQFLQNCSEWDVLRCNLSLSYRMSPRNRWNESVVNHRLMAWGDGGIADPRISHQKFPDHIQTHLWKVAAALKTVRLYNGTFSGTAKTASAYNFTIFKEINVTACVPLPYLILIGNFSFNDGISCIKCRLYSCINSSIEFKPGYSLMILQQRSHIWLPVNLERLWAQNPVDALVLEFFRKVLKRTKRLIGIVVGKKVLTIERQIWLRCDWNSTSFCITNLRYNESQHDWSIIQKYLEGNSSVTDMINNLHTNIQEIFGKPFENEDAATLAQSFLKQFEGLDPKGIIQSLGHTAGGIGISLIFVICCFLCMYVCFVRPSRKSIATLWWAFLSKQKKKEGIEANIGM